jgi:hypothetical protein
MKGKLDHAVPLTAEAKTFAAAEICGEGRGG